MFIAREAQTLAQPQSCPRLLQPGNLLVNKNCDLKICDFGLARGVDNDSQQNKLTEYVVTRWYRAPELLVENDNYNEAIDMWSVGCILAEFLGRKALFPGRDYLQQLRLIIDVLGTPTASDLAIIQNEQAVEYIKSLPKREKVNFRKLYPNANPQAIDLLERMLVFDPSKRITATDALAHPYMEALHNVNDEPTAEPFGCVPRLAASTPSSRLTLSGRLSYAQLRVRAGQRVGARPQAHDLGAARLPPSGGRSAAARVAIRHRLERQWPVRSRSGRGSRVWTVAEATAALAAEECEPPPNVGRRS